MKLKKNGKVFMSTFVGTGPSSYKKLIYRAVVSQRLRNTVLGYTVLQLFCTYNYATCNVLSHAKRCCFCFVVMYPASGITQISLI